MHSWMVLLLHHFSEPFSLSIFLSLGLLRPIQMDQVHNKYRDHSFLLREYHPFLLWLSHTLIVPHSVSTSHLWCLLCNVRLFEPSTTPCAICHHIFAEITRQKSTTVPFESLLFALQTLDHLDRWLALGRHIAGSLCGSGMFNGVLRWAVKSWLIGVVGDLTDTDFILSSRIMTFDDRFLGPLSTPKSGKATLDNPNLYMSLFCIEQWQRPWSRYQKSCCLMDQTPYL